MQVPSGMVHAREQRNMDKVGSPPGTRKAQIPGENRYFSTLQACPKDGMHSQAELEQTKASSSQIIWWCQWEQSQNQQTV